MSKILIFTMQKVGSSSMKHALELANHQVDRGYEENILELDPLIAYHAIYSMVREPVARNISWMFEEYGDYFLEKEYTNEQIKEHFFRSINQDYPLTWFDNIFLPVVGLDVYKYPFPYDGPLLLGKVCVMRTDTMLEHHRASTVNTRPYGELYKTFLGWVKFPEDYLDTMYKSKYTQHFFKPEEIDKLYERWIDD